MTIGERGRSISLWEESRDEIRHQPTEGRRGPAVAGLRAWSFPPLVILIVSGLFLVSCRTLAPRPTAAAVQATPSQIRFFLESDAPGADEVVLPVSGVRISRAAQPLLTEDDIASVDHARLELGEGVLFQLNAHGIRKLAEAAEQTKGRRLVVLLNDTALGIYRIEGNVADGRLYLFVEVPDAELPRLVATLKSSTSSQQREWRVAK